MKFDSKEFKNLYSVLRNDYPGLSEYMAYLAINAWEYDQSNKSSKNKKKNKYTKPDFTKIEVPSKEEIEEFSKSAIKVYDKESGNIIKECFDNV
jgi:hypothetical protein